MEPGGAVTVDVDAAGLILTADGGAPALLGSPLSDLVGRNLFRDVEPALATPACLGRFLEGVRSGHLDESIPVVLGRETGSLTLQIGMAPGPDGGYRIALDPVATARPGRHREAMLAVDLRSRAEVVDPLVCEREPIQIPGTIQPPNALVAADPETFIIGVASETADAVLGTPGVVGRRLSDILPQAFVLALRAAVATDTVSRGVPDRSRVELGEPPRPFAVMAHLHDDRLVLEFEAAPVNPGDFGVPSHATIRETITRLRTSPGFGDLVRTAADDVRELTGYERVLIYRFDVEWNGESVAESIVETWGEPLLGLRFPASDIPRQARELYTKSPARFVVDRDAAPAALLAAPSENRPLDMTFALSRSLSPVHVEYQRNLGVNGSMSIAIMVDGRLWGLVIGHHRRPHYVAPETRDALAVVADALALLIEDHERKAAQEEQTRHFGTQVALLEQMAAGDDVAIALTTGPARLTDLFGATGAAVVTGRTATTVGDAPLASEIVRLADDLRAASPEAWVATDHLAALVPDAAAHRGTASGLLAAFIGPQRENALLWFRPEIVRTTLWGGDPNKTVLADALSSAVLPRRSFERWIETRQGYAEPWTTGQIETARALARAVESVALRASRRVVELSHKQEELLGALDQKDRLIAQKDLLTREVDHRVKNSLQIVSAFLRMQSRHVADPDAQAAFEESYGRVMSIARVHDSLYQSETVTDVDLGLTIEALCGDLAGLTGDEGDLELVAEHGLMVPYRQAVALCLIATELVTNARKYAYPGASGVVEVVVGREESGLRLRVCDRGGGLPPDWETKRKGLGMKLVRAMLDQIGATMQVESGRGACFTIRC